MQKSIKSNTNQVFTFNNKQLRTLGTPENPLFCLKDACDCLDIPNPAIYKSRLEKRFQKGITSSYPLETAGGIQDFTFINEPQFYYLVMRSDKKEAIVFQDWVFTEVLPSIRKNGFYDANNVISQEDYTKLSNELIQLETTNKALCTVIAKYENGLTLPQQKDIVKAVKAKAQNDSKAYSLIYNAVYTHFDVPSYKNIDTNRFNEAIDFIKHINVEVSDVATVQYEPINETLGKAKKIKNPALVEVQNIIDNALVRLKSQIGVTYFKLDDKENQELHIKRDCELIKNLVPILVLA
jgi:prophage antirepressor-like protein